jgi:hypothetical protein
MTKNKSGRPIPIITTTGSFNKLINKKYKNFGLKINNKLKLNMTYWQRPWRIGAGADR